MLRSIAALLPPRRPAMEPKAPSRERAPKAVERSHSSVGATSSLPESADFDVDELLAEFGW